MLIVILFSFVACRTLRRTGRCGRAGRRGLVMNFANPETKFVARRFGKQLGVRVRDCEIRDGRVFLKGPFDQAGDTTAATATAGEAD